jgi:2-methylcitrate dehydratase PrpD
MDSPTLAQEIGTFAVKHPYASLPAEVIDSVRKRVLDVLGICVAASDLDTSVGVRAYVARQGGRNDAHAIGLSDALPASLAALVNGTLAHSLDYDDTHLPSVLHPSASVIPAALAMAETHQRSGQALIAAIACGLEVCVRLGMAGYDAEKGSSLFFEHGQHATSICGTLGAVVATSLLAGFDEEQITHALGLAASMGSGVIEANRTGGSVKRMHCGWAAHSACVATDLVHHGFTGPPTILEGRFGFFQAWLHGDFYPEWITSELGVRWEVPGIFFKPYPANHFTHTAIDAAAALRQHGIDLAAIDHLELGVPASIVRTIGEPIETKRTPTTAYMAQFSGPYAVALGLLGGSGLGAGLVDYTDELANNPARRALMAKVSVVSNEECSAIFPHQFPSVLRATLTNGEVIEEKALSNLGGNERPLTYEQLAVKFSDNASRHLSATSVRLVENLVGGLETLTTLGPLFDAVAFSAR